ncbi:S8 family serine peptidase [Ornithinibacillus sp. 179-J 7C1 HS]|uniref:S8 family serine peptidase n=1 Tax=Ornithinibacillus sp. 179-J 7C1 HS TaxID=3142384 RepID=UPI0039A36DFD
MRKLNVCSIVAVLLWTISGLPTIALGSDESSFTFYETTNSIHLDDVLNRQIIIKAKEDFNPADFQVELIEVLKEQGLYLVKVPDNKDYKLVLYQLNEAETVEMAEPDYERHTTFYRHDPYMTMQWYLEPIGMFNAWDITRGSTDVTIAVLDTGVNASHPDLVGRVLDGYDFINDDNDPLDDQGHGTFVAGVIAANANRMGPVGINHQSRILPVKIMNENGEASIYDVVEGIYYAIEQNVDIINMSYRATQSSSIEREAIVKAYKEGITLIGAAGNDSKADKVYPAAYNEVIAVTAADEDGSIAEYSNFGTWVDIMAPGTDIIGTNQEGTYSVGSGTSFAAPVVSGIASLLLSKNPDLSPSQIKWFLEAGAYFSRKQDWNQQAGFGMVNAYKSLTIPYPSLIDDTANQFTNALDISDGGNLMEKIDVPTDQDWYRLEFSQNTSISISLTNIPLPLDLVAELYQYESGSLQKIQVIDSAGMGGNEQLSMELNPGVYALAIKDNNYNWSPFGYQLAVDIEQGATRDGLEESVIFPDIKGSWAAEEIMFLSNRGTIVGFPDGTFKLNANIDRAAAATVIAKELTLPMELSSFQDVSNSHWASQYIGAAAKAGILTGYGNNNFKPNSPLTRAEMASILVRAYQLKGADARLFRDVTTAHWAYEDIQSLVANGITAGYPDESFKPNAYITRAEFSAMVARIIDDSFKVK